MMTTCSSDRLLAAFQKHPAGVFVITADAGGGPAGLTATTVFPASATPPMLVFCLSSHSSAAPTIAAADTVVIHLLAAEQLDLAKLFATSGIDRFADCSMWTRLSTGEPLLRDVARWVRGRIVSRTVAGSSTVVTVDALDVGGRDPDLDGADSALVYHDRVWHRLGEHSQLP